MKDLKNPTNPHPKTKPPNSNPSPPASSDPPHSAFLSFEGLQLLKRLNEAYLKKKNKKKFMN